MTAPPSPQTRLEFLNKIQRILSEGSFSATYKFALLHVLADLAVLKGGHDGSELTLTTYDIAEQFTELYWRQAVPFPGAATGTPLRQNTGAPAAVISAIQEAQHAHGPNVAAVRPAPAWPALVQTVEHTVKNQPLWKLQTTASGQLEFLYKNTGQGNSITLFPGVAYCLREFHGLILDLVRAAWLRYIRRYNGAVLGSRVELADFLFGSARSDVTRLQQMLHTPQGGACFYCQESLGASPGEVDHFIPWSMYPIDLGHNFVLAHAQCNGHKSDRLAATEFLERWCRRNHEQGDTLAEQFSAAGIICDLASSRRITAWAYDRLASVGGHAWLKGRNGLERLAPEWRDQCPGWTD